MRKPIAAALIFALVLSLAAGCSSKQTNIPDSVAPSYEEGSTSKNGFYNDAQSDLAPPGEDAAVPESTAQKRIDFSPESDQKIIYSGSVGIETTEYDATVSDIKTLIENYDCLIGTSDESNEDQSWRDKSYDTSPRASTWTILVPAERFSALMDSIGTVHGHILSKKQDSDNLTRQYHDTENRIAALKVQEQRLLSFMEAADSVTDMLEIEGRLTEVRYELESLQGQNNSIDFQVQYATLHISLKEVVLYDTNGMPFFQRVSRAFSTSSSGFIQAVQGLLILLILLLPYLAVAGVVAAILYATRNRRAQCKMKRQQKKAVARKDMKRTDEASPK